MNPAEPLRLFKLGHSWWQQKMCCLRAGCDDMEGLESSAQCHWCTRRTQSSTFNSLLCKSIAACITFLCWHECNRFSRHVSLGRCVPLSRTGLCLAGFCQYSYICPFLTGSKAFDFHPSNCLVMFSVHVCVKESGSLEAKKKKKSRIHKPRDDKYLSQSLLLC